MALLDGFDFTALGEMLSGLGADGWLLYDFHGLNPVATRVVGMHGMGTRRFFVLLSRPEGGRPVAVAHRIELASFDGFPGEVRPYAAWSELHAVLGPLVAGKTLAMEVSPLDRVPYLDRVPHGVIELLEGFGARIVSSAPLVTRFAARWSPAELAGHRRAAEALAGIAQETLRWAGSELARGAEVRETAVQRRVMEAFAPAGLVTDHPPIVGFQARAPTAGSRRARCCCSICGRGRRGGPCSPTRRGWRSPVGRPTPRCGACGRRCARRGMRRSAGYASDGGERPSQGPSSTMPLGPSSARPGMAMHFHTAPVTRSIGTCTARDRTSTTSRPPTTASCSQASASR